jgi:cyclic beta-1,2-glucan synthetase
VPAGATGNSSAIRPSVGGKCSIILRRTLSAPFAILALLAGLLLPLDAALIRNGFVLATIALPPTIPVIATVPPRRPGITLSSHFRALGGDLKLALILSALTIIFLADQAWLMADAIFRTLYRLTISRKHLLGVDGADIGERPPRLSLAGDSAHIGADSIEREIEACEMSIFRSCRLHADTLKSASRS